MWHSPNQRLRALANAKNRERERARRPFHIKRIVASLSTVSHDTQSPPVPPVPIRVILNDLTIKGVGVFAQSSLVPGIEVIMNISEPMKLEIRSRVIWCQEHDANSHILSQDPFSYRLGVEFLLSNVEEQQSVKAFWEEVCRNYLYSPKAV